MEPEIAEPWTQLRTDIFEESTGFSPKVSASVTLPIRLLQQCVRCAKNVVAAAAAAVVVGGGAGLHRNVRPAEYLF